MAKKKPEPAGAAWARARGTKTLLSNRAQAPSITPLLPETKVAFFYSYLRVTPIRTGTDIKEICMSMFPTCNKKKNTTTIPTIMRDQNFTGARCSTDVRTTSPERLKKHINWKFYIYYYYYLQLYAISCILREPSRQIIVIYCIFLFNWKVYK